MGLLTQLIQRDSWGDLYDALLLDGEQPAHEQSPGSSGVIVDTTTNNSDNGEHPQNEQTAVSNVARTPTSFRNAHSFRRELLLRDRLGRTPLYYACAKQQAQGAVVSLMVLQCGGGMASMSKSRDICGNTPLHAAAANGNANVLQVLMDHLSTTTTATTSSKEYSGNKSGSGVVQQKQHTHYCYAVNDVGSTPLLLAWKKYLDPSFSLFRHVNASMGRHSPQVVERVQILSGCAGMCVFHSQSLQQHANDIANEEKEAEQRDCCRARLCDVWNKTVCLVARAIQHCDGGIVGTNTTNHSNDNSNNRDDCLLANPLHDIVTVGGKRHVQCPTVAYWLAIRLYPNQLNVTDKEGNLPIHLAAQHPNLPVIPMIDDGDLLSTTTSNSGSKNTNRTLQQQDKNDKSNPTVHQQLPIVYATESVLTQLVTCHNGSAVVRDRHGRLPIHLAIASGKNWHDGGIQALVQAAPATLEEGDAVTGLPPFLQAASCPKASLTVVWELLRARPQLVSNNVAVIHNNKKNTDKEITVNNTTRTHITKYHGSDEKSDDATCCSDIASVVVPCKRSSAGRLVMTKAAKKLKTYSKTSRLGTKPGDVHQK